MSKPLEQFDFHVRPGVEAFVLHSWYCDLMDASADDTSVWSAQTMRNIRSFVERDRQAMRRSEEHTSELQSLMRISYVVFCLQVKNYSPHVSDLFNISDI